MRASSKRASRDARRDALAVAHAAAWPSEATIAALLAEATPGDGALWIDLGNRQIEARANADAHAATPDAELPLAARSQPWLPDDHRAFKRRPPTYFKTQHKSPG